MGAPSFRRPDKRAHVTAVLLWILYFVCGGLTLTQTHVPDHETCDVFAEIPALETICRDAQPLAVVSLITAVLRESRSWRLLSSMPAGVLPDPC